MQTKKSKKPEGIHVTLGPKDDVFTILHSAWKFRKYQRSINAIWNHEENKGVKEKRKQLWWIGPDDTVFLPKKPPEEPLGKARSEWCHHHQLHRHPQAIDVYLGFMDEEINARLAALIKHQTDKVFGSSERPVILVERGKVEPDKPILEWRLGNYPIKNQLVSEIVHASPQGELGIHTRDPKTGEWTYHVEKLDVEVRDEDRDEEGKVDPEKIAARDVISNAPHRLLGKMMSVFMQWDMASDLDWLHRGVDVNRYVDVIHLLQHKREAKAKVPLPTQPRSEIVESIKDGDPYDAARHPRVAVPRDGRGMKILKEITKFSGEVFCLVQEGTLHPVWKRLETDCRLDPTKCYRFERGSLDMKSYLLISEKRGGPKRLVPDEPPKKQKENKAAGGPWLSVVRFNVGNDCRAPIVVIRSPEMGLQPSLMSPFVAFIFKAIAGMSSQLAAAEAERKKRIQQLTRDEWAKDAALWEDTKDKVYKEGKKLKPWDIWEWPLRVSEFGAQGSASKELPPGTTMTVAASLFVGVDIASDITVTGTRAPGGDEPVTKDTVVYRGLPDTAETRPHWKAYEERERGGHRELVPKPLDRREKPSGYTDFETGSKCKAYAVVSLCTPAGVYDFLRVSVDEFQLQHEYKHWRKLLREDSARQKRQDQTEDGNEDVADVMDVGWADVVLTKPVLTTVETIERAEDIAAWLFRHHADTLKLTTWSVDPESPFSDREKKIGKKGKPLKQVIAEIKEAYKSAFYCGPDGLEDLVTLTMSYFGGDEDKQAAAQVGISGVNMEDYHILRVLRSAMNQGASPTSDYPVILGWRIDRINCDPIQLPDDVVRDFKKYAADPRAMLTIDDYVATIIWGLRGVLRSDIEANQGLKDAVEWKFLDWYRGNWPENKKFFWSFAPAGDTTWIPDPFCIEIATDFLSELSEMDPGIAGDHNEPEKKKVRKLAKAVIKAWERKDRTKAKWEDVFDSDEDDGTAARARALLTCLADEWGWREQKETEEETEKQPLKIWLRPKKWDRKKITQPTLQDAANHFDGAAIDRAFYKSSNMMALQTMADYFLWEGGPKKKRIPKIGKMETART